MLFDRLRSAEKHLLAILAITILINIPFLSPRLVFAHDTLNHVIYFHFGYSELFFHNDFPKWNPLTACGLPFDLDLLAQLPTDYVAMAIGWLLGIPDAMLLFKIS